MTLPDKIAAYQSALKDLQQALEKFTAEIDIPTGTFDEITSLENTAEEMKPWLDLPSTGGRNSSP